MDNFKNAVSEKKKVLSVTELTCLIRVQLETKFPAVSVQGEVSNCTYQSSGHIYFTLKDHNSVLPCVVFRSTAVRLRFKIEMGRHYLVSGALRIYEPRGAYQLVVTQVEDSSREGELYREFLRRKEHFAALGYFDESAKKPLPFLPSVIGIVTSRTGAVIRDLLQVINRRCPSGLEIRLYPVRVQGEGAAAEIAAGITFFNESGADVIIIGRGGGSIEDLWAFNENEVVEAVYNSRIPVISAVGHETDFTLSDFAASLRAATPSVAGELCVPNLLELRQRTVKLKSQLFLNLSAALRFLGLRLDACKPERLQRGLDSSFQYGAQQTDYVFAALRSGYKSLLSDCSHNLEQMQPLRQQQQLLNILQENRHSLMKRQMQMGLVLRTFLKTQESRLADMGILLTRSDFSSLLQRGFSILTDEEGNIVKSVTQVQTRQDLHVLLSDGSLQVKTEKIIPE
jgi:exodeoxyribonuclease VII large subunit